MFATLNMYAGFITAFMIKRHIYLTSDGGGHLDTLYNLVAQLGEHVEVVNQNQVAAMALAQHRQDKRTK